MPNNLTLNKGSVFTYAGEFRIPVNNVPQVDYTGWTIAAKLFEKNGIEIEDAVTAEWTNQETGIFEFDIPTTVHDQLRSGVAYQIHLLLTAPGDRTLPPVKIFFSVESV